MKYKVGDKVVVQGYEWKIIEIHGEAYIGKSINNKYLISTFEDKDIGLNEKNKPTHEDTIMNLNELNTAKTRQIERLMKFIAKDYEIIMDFDRDLIRETLIKEIRDEDLVNAIMYHIRKGKW